MYSYQLDFVVDEVLRDLPTPAQKLLKEHTGRNFSTKDASRLWPLIVEHKWYLGERLGRDIGFRAAAVDFVENIYEPALSFNGSSGFIDRFVRAIGSAARYYFRAKSGILIN